MEDVPGMIFIMWSQPMTEVCSGWTRDDPEAIPAALRLLLQRDLPYTQNHAMVLFERVRVVGSGVTPCTMQKGPVMMKIESCVHFQRHFCYSSGL
jgi:hypothetical protein